MENNQSGGTFTISKKGDGFSWKQVDASGRMMNENDETFPTAEEAEKAIRSQNPDAKIEHKNQ